MVENFTPSQRCFEATASQVRHGMVRRRITSHRRRRPVEGVPNPAVVFGHVGVDSVLGRIARGFTFRVWRERNDPTNVPPGWIFEEQSAAAITIARTDTVAATGAKHRARKLLTERVPIALQTVPQIHHGGFRFEQNVGHCVAFGQPEPDHGAQFTDHLVLIIARRPDAHRLDVVRQLDTVGQLDQRYVVLEVVLFVAGMDEVIVRDNGPLEWKVAEDSKRGQRNDQREFRKLAHIYVPVRIVSSSITDPPQTTLNVLPVRKMSSPSDAIAEPEYVPVYVV
uniref:Uncharacterized protein n=1 Tax=Anopheles farauti TaxID=69004 RepID=A0A182QNJ9_9DIPT